MPQTTIAHSLRDHRTRAHAVQRFYSEELRNNAAKVEAMMPVSSRPTWQPDESSTVCTRCNLLFTVRRRRVCGAQHVIQMLSDRSLTRTHYARCSAPLSTVWRALLWCLHQSQSATTIDRIPEQGSRVRFVLRARERSVATGTAQRCEIELGAVHLCHLPRIEISTTTQQPISISIS